MMHLFALSIDESLDRISFKEMYLAGYPIRH